MLNEVYNSRILELAGNIPRIGRLAFGSVRFFQNFHRARQKGFAMPRQFGFALHPVKEAFAEFALKLLDLLAQ